MTDLSSLRNQLKDHKQEHLLQFWDQLDNEQQELLYHDLKSIKFDKVCKAFQETNPNSDQNEKIDDLLQPLSSEVHESITRTSTEKLKTYRENGKYFLTIFLSFYFLLIPNI